MKRVYGNENVTLLECVNPVRNRWRVRWDVRNDELGASWMEHEFDHKPDLAEIKSIVRAWYNQKIDEKILSEFSWNDMPVWLSSENQFNHKAAFDLAMQMQGQHGTLPVTFKFGTDEEPVYFAFEDMATFTDFYTKSIAYVNAVLTEGWAEKGRIDWSAY